MALVKVKHNCILCNHEVEEYDRSKMSDKEYYLTFWKYELGTPEAEEAWKIKETMTKKQAPMVMSDISGYVSQIDGTYIESRSKHRDHLKRHRMVEVGNDVPMRHKPVEVTNTEARKRQIAEQVYSKLKY